MRSKQSLELLLPPSVNELHINRRGSYKRILNEYGRDYIYNYSRVVRGQLRQLEHVMIEDYAYVELYWVLRNRNADSHNYEKALFDMLEKAGFVKNDKYIMARTQSIDFDPKRPRVTIKW